MPAISQEEADEFERLVRVGQRLLERGKALSAREQLSEPEQTELAEINLRLREIDDWFNRTAK